MIGNRHAGQPKRQPCREHNSVGAVLRCPTCGPLFWGRQEALRAREDNSWRRRIASPTGSDGELRAATTVG